MLLYMSTKGGRQLQKLADSRGMSIYDMLKEATYDSIAPAICTSCEEYDMNLEPDAVDCHCCELCDTGGSVTSCLVIAGII